MDVQFEPKDNKITQSSFFPSTIDGWTLIYYSLSITILFIGAAFIGSGLPAYVELQKKFPQNSWLIAFLWVLASLISYGSFWFIKDVDPTIYPTATLVPYFVLINLLNLTWIIFLYEYLSFITALIFIFIIIVIYIYLIIMLLQINVWSSVLQIPLVLLYIYLMYSLIHLASVNGVTI